MSEQRQRARVVKLLRVLDAVAVENPALPGTPDINYAEGWLELKWLRTWPKGEATPVVIPHFTVQQRVWHLRRRRCGGRSWVLIQCKREWLLMDGVVAAIELNFMPRLGLIEICDHYWPTGLDREELIRCISRTPSAYSLTAGDAVKLKERLRGAVTFR